MTKNFGLYIHIPFCESICSYCDFCKKIKKDSVQEDSYITKLIEEINSYKDKFSDSLNTIFIGGGTPNSLSDYNLDRLLECLSKIKSVEEFSIETNPDLFTINQAFLFRKYKVNRVSLGVQTFDSSILKKLNRKHTSAEVEFEVKTLKEYGINNINIDLMFGLPDETREVIKNDLNCFYKLDIPHISYYSLILEEKTLLYKEVKSGLVHIPDDDFVADNYLYIINSLEEHGFKQYEISNFSKKGKECIHNKHYWLYNDYIGCGSGASGLLDNTYRYTNESNVNTYINSSDVKKVEEELDISDNKTEFMIMGLRLLKGVNLAEYSFRFSTKLQIDFDISKILEDNLVEIKNGYLRLTNKGLPLANIVWEVFV